MISVLLFDRIKRVELSVMSKTQYFVEILHMCVRKVVI